jgi:hypothetical protein
MKHELIKGTLSRDFRPTVFFIKQLHLCPWLTGSILFSNGFVFAVIFDYDIDFLWSILSLTLLTTKKIDFKVEYLREYEAICKKIWTFCIRGLDGTVWWKKPGGRKSRDRVPLTWKFKNPTNEVEKYTICICHIQRRHCDAKCVLQKPP